MELRLISILCFTCILDPLNCHGTLLLGAWYDTIECATDADLTFKFISNKTNTSFTIGECDLITKSCRLFETSLNNKYSLDFTGRGGLLRIALDNDTIGKYICCETYNPMKFVSIDIFGQNKCPLNSSASVHVETLNISANHSGETAMKIEYVIGLLIGALIGVAVCLGVCIKNRSKVRRSLGMLYQAIPLSQDETLTEIKTESSKYKQRKGERQSIRKTI